MQVTAGGEPAPATSATSTTPAFTHFEAGALSEWRQWEFFHPAWQRTVKGKAFLQERLGLTGLEMSLSAVPPGAGIPYLHRHHRNEEVYVFLAGRGQFQVDGQCLAVSEGSVVRVSPAGRRAYRNNGEVPLVFLVIQAPAGTGASSTTRDGERVDEPLVWPAG